MILSEVGLLFWGKASYGERVHIQETRKEQMTAF